MDSPASACDLRRDRMRRVFARRLTGPALIAALGAGFFLVFGAWALLSPSSFYESIATYPPYNEHLIHDLGAFQIGIGAALAGGVVLRSALLAGLAGGAAGSVAHFISHMIDRDAGGRASDPISTGLIAVVLVIALVWAWGRW